jgi:hypothetical protein
MAVRAGRDDGGVEAPAVRIAYAFVEVDGGIDVRLDS